MGKLNVQKQTCLLEKTTPGRSLMESLVIGNIKKAEVKPVVATCHLSGMEGEAPLWCVLKKALQTFHHFLSSVVDAFGLEP